jgi:hypothetical protein
VKAEITWASAASVTASIVMYMAVCIVTGEIEAWDDARFYRPLLFVIPLILAFCWPRQTLLIVPTFAAFQWIAALLWRAVKTPEPLELWPMGLVTVAFYVLPPVAIGGVAGVGLRYVVKGVVRLARLATGR